MRRTLFPLVVLMIGPLLTPALAQVQHCRIELAQAEEGYTFGRFEEAQTWLQVCIEKLGVPQADLAQAYRLMALAYLGQDLSEEAKTSIASLLKADPAYAPNPVQDPPAFVAMVNQHKAQNGTPPPPKQNQAPEALVLLGPLNMTPGQPPFVRDLRTLFSDPDSDPLRYTAQSEAAAVAAVTVVENELRITPGPGSGETLVTVQAIDPENLTATQRFQVFVAAPAEPTAEATPPAANRPPEPTHVLEPLVLTLGEEGFTMDLANEPTLFTDPDGDVLHYTASSEQVQVASAAVIGTTLRVVPGTKAGQTRILISTTDPGGLGSTTALYVTTQPVPQKKKGSSSFRRVLYFGALLFVIYAINDANQ